MASLPFCFALSFLTLRRLADVRCLPAGLDPFLAGFFSVRIRYLDDLHFVACLPDPDPILEFVLQTGLIEARFPLQFDVLERSVCALHLAWCSALAGFVSCKGILHVDLLAAQFVLFGRALLMAKMMNEKALRRA